MRHECNGSTSDFDSENLGSTPSAAAFNKTHVSLADLIHKYYELSMKITKN